MPKPSEAGRRRPWFARNRTRLGDAATILLVMDGLLGEDKDDIEDAVLRLADLVEAAMHAQQLGRFGRRAASAQQLAGNVADCVRSHRAARCRCIDKKRLH